MSKHRHKFGRWTLGGPDGGAKRPCVDIQKCWVVQTMSQEQVERILNGPKYKKVGTVGSIADAETLIPEKTLARDTILYVKVKL